MEMQLTGQPAATSGIVTEIASRAHTFEPPGTSTATSVLLVELLNRDAPLILRSFSLRGVGRKVGCGKRHAVRAVPGPADAQWVAVIGLVEILCAVERVRQLRGGTGQGTMRCRVEQSLAEIQSPVIVALALRLVDQH